MQIESYRLAAGAREARGTVVIIDVYRAFTSAPLLFSKGVRELILVATPQEAFRLKEQNPGLLLVGEVEGAPIEGFDLGNSPSRILQTDSSLFHNKTVVMRTSSGVQGVLAAIDHADEVLLGSFVLAGSTARHIRSGGARRVSLVAMGLLQKEIAPEDEACARYIAHLLGEGEYDQNQALGEILFHPTTQKFLRRETPHFPPEDPVLCLQRDLYDFVLQAGRSGDLVTVSRLTAGSTQTTSDFRIPQET